MFQWGSSKRPASPDEAVPPSKRARAESPPPDPPRSGPLKISDLSFEQRGTLLDQLKRNPESSELVDKYIKRLDLDPDTQIKLAMKEAGDFLRDEVDEAAVLSEIEESCVYRMHTFIPRILAIRTEFPHTTAPAMIWGLLLILIDNVGRGTQPGLQINEGEYAATHVPRFNSDMRVALLSTVERRVDKEGLGWIEEAADELQTAVEECKAGWYELNVASVLQHMRDRAPAPQI